MNKIRANKFFLFLLVMTVLVCAASYKVNTRDEHYRLQIASLQSQLAHASIQPQVRVDTIRDSIQVATSAAITVDRSQYEHAHADKSLLHDMQVSTAQIKAESTVATATEGTVKGITCDSLFTYSDRWLQFRCNYRDSTLHYSVRDSVTAFVVRKYKHRFLWLRWGTKGYDVKVVSHNPRATVTCARQIVVQ